MKRKYILVYFLLFFSGISLFSNGLKQDFADTYKRILVDQKEFFVISKKMKDKYFEDTLYINASFDMMRDSLRLYISLLNLYSRINPECKESKQSGKKYLRKMFHLEAESKKQIAGFILKHQSNFIKPELISFSEKCIKYNEQISILLLKFK